MIPGVLSQLNYGVIRWTSSDVGEGLPVAGLEPAPLKLAPERSLAVKLPLLMWRITNDLRPIEIGQEAGICTRTVSFTGRDAADYTTNLID